MTDTVSVQIVGLDEVLAGLTWQPDLQRAIEVELGEAWRATSEDLIGGTIAAPGKGIWPVGTVHNLGKSNEWYDSPKAIKKRGYKLKGGRDKGRSLRRWQPKQPKVDASGFELRTQNKAKSGRGVLYAEYVHKTGEDVGQGEVDAFKAFAKHGVEALERIQDIITAHLDGRR